MMDLSSFLFFLLLIIFFYYFPPALPLIILLSGWVIISVTTSLFSERVYDDTHAINGCRDSVGIRVRVSEIVLII